MFPFAASDSGSVTTMTAAASAIVIPRAPGPVSKAGD